MYKQNGFADYKLTETLTDKALLLLSIDDLLRILQKEEQKILTYKASLIHRHISRASEEKIRYTTLTKELERKSTTCPNPFTVALIKELVEIRRSQEQKFEMPFTPLLNALIAHNLYPTVVK